MSTDINESHQPEFAVRFVRTVIQSHVARKGIFRGNRGACRKETGKQKATMENVPAVEIELKSVGFLVAWSENLPRKENGLKRIKRDIADSHFPSKYRQLCQQAAALMLVKCLTTFTQRYNKRRAGRLGASAIMQRKATAVKKKKTTALQEFRAGIWSICLPLA